jgi:uncharacterized protein
MLNTLRLALLALLLAGFGFAQAQQPVPALSARVIDQTATLTPEQRAALEAQLAAFEAEAGSQLVVLMVPTTQPEDIASYAQRVGETWKLGRREVGDGLLIVVAKDDRRMWIATAKALEGAIPDLAAKRVIDGAMRPAFRANDYAGGLTAAVSQLTQLIRGEQLPMPQRDDRWRGETGGGDGGLDLTTLAMFFFVAVPILGAVLTGVFGRKLGSLATAGAAGGVGFWITASLLVAAGVGLIALLLVGLFGVGAAGRSMSSGRRGGGVLPPIIWGGGGGGWGGGFGGGGFGSGGGGDFGGGGAGGDW